MKIAITGHRPNKLGNDYELKSPLIQDIKSEIMKFLDSLGISDDDLTLITGMALGIDTLFAKIAIERNLKFIAALPCLEQDSKWPQRSKDVYWEILNHPDCQIKTVTDKTYTSTCMQKRNEWMVDNCDKLIAVWDGTSGGTENCIRYAKSKGIEIFHINPKKFSHKSFFYSNF